MPSRIFILTIVVVAADREWLPLRARRRLPLIHQDRCDRVGDRAGILSWRSAGQDAHAYVDSINAAGGVNGRPLELFIYDDSSDAAKANSFVKRLIQQDNVDLIIGPSTTGSSMAMAPVVEASKVPMLALGAGSVIIEPVKPYIFACRIPIVWRPEGSGGHEEEGHHQFALLSDTGGYGKSGPP